LAVVQVPPRRGHEKEAILMSTESREGSFVQQLPVFEPAQPKPADGFTRPPAWLLWGLALTILLSAFLLFQVQPLISKFILPWFGGSPAVWTTCMLFFQCLLFCGYAYAHLTSRLLSGRGQGLLHLGLIVAAVILLPITPDAGWKPQPGMEPTWRILGLLAVSVGLPYFVLSSTGPLGQAWFSRAYAQRSPYRLYALSNIGSLAALLTFPVLFEPAFAADTQAWLWSASFVVFGLLCAGVAVWVWRDRTDRDTETGATSSKSEVVSAKEAPSAGRRLLWLTLPAGASLMLLATTNQACQNVAVVPLLWVVPLALYLLTFIICFDHERWYRRRAYCAVAAVLVFLSAGGADWLSDVIPDLVPGIDAPSFGLSFVQERVLYFATMFMVCMVCHGELVRLRPSARHLTEYYLMIAAGGALGGAFVGLVAPRIFPGYWEWNLGLVISFLVVAVYWLKSNTSGPAWLGGRNVVPPAETRRSAWAVPRAVVVAVLSTIGLFIIVYWQVEAARPSPTNIFQRRNFYGVVKVFEYTDERGHYRQFKSGGISHGRQWISDDPAKRREAISYFSPETGAGRAIRYFQHKPDMRVGVVGLGVGTLAAYAIKPGHVIRFYEINPEVVTIANSYFTYLKDCDGHAEVVLGDARLSLEAEPSQNFDVLVLDAFSGDAPPVHLLTREAFAVYRRHLNPEGIIVVNIKNRYVKLAPVVRGAAEFHGFDTTRIWTGEDKARLLFEVDFMLLTNNQEFLKSNRPILAPNSAADFEPVLWTDHYSNLFQLLIHK
jgi:hypothetical protein